MKYVKRPVVIEAIQVFDNNFEDIEIFCKDNIMTQIHVMKGKVTSVDLPTLEGVMTARLGDYIIKGVRGELYPCKQDIFFETYTPVGE